MKRPVEWCVVGGVMFLLFTLVPWHTGLSQASQDVTSDGASGRFRIVMREGVRADTFLLDTATGRTWRLIQYTDVVGQPQIWKYEVKIDTDKELTDWSGQQQILPKSKSPDTADGENK